MADFATAASWLIAVVLMLAGFGKVLRPGSQWHRLLAGTELGLAIVLVSGPSVQAAALATFFCGTLFVYSLRQRSACRCFGENLPATSVISQRLRNGVLLIVAAAALLTELFASGSPNDVIGDLVAGSGAGIGLVVGPWLFAWARQVEVTA